MEQSILTEAHEHIRSAASATVSNDFGTASVEHELAATAFKQASKETENSEALRILALLENHHHQFATIIKAPPARVVVTEENHDDAASPQQQKTESTGSPASKLSSARAISPSPSSSPPARGVSRRRLPRDYSSSIANNLATARGIPSRRGTPTSSPISVTTAVAARADRSSQNELGTPPKTILNRLAKRPDEAHAEDRQEKEKEQGDQAVSRSLTTASTLGFRNFYSNMVGTVLSNIPAPLVFGAFPLGPNSSASSSKPPPAEPTKTTKTRPSESSRATAKPDELDISKYISKTTLQALRHDQGPNGPFANAESFYVVPTSGGTVSYAGILSHSGSHTHHHAAQNPQLADVEEESSDMRGSSHEEFVDARDTPYPPSPTRTRHARESSKGTVTSARTIPAGRGAGLKTTEELELENRTLRAVLDQQSKRLLMWEATSQESYKSLAQSLRSARGSGLKQQLSDPSSLSRALTMGQDSPTTPPPVPEIPAHIRRAAERADAKEKELRERRIRELEKALEDERRRTEEAERVKVELEMRNEKSAVVIARYREQWEKLKAGARKKEREREERKLRDSKRDGDGVKDGEEEKEEDGDEVVGGSASVT